MTTTRTPGITVGTDGRRFIDKRYRGIRIGMRVGASTQEQAKRRLQAQMQDIDIKLARRAHPRPTFADCAAHYLAQSREKRSFEAMQVHVRALLPHVGHLEPHQVHDGTLAPFVSQRIASCVTAVTINRSLEVVRTILNRAALSYRDEDGRPWLETIPPLITMLPEAPRPAYAAAPAAHGPVRGQQRPARQQRLRTRMGLGSARSGDLSQRLRHTFGLVQVQSRSRRYPQ
jgi:hypothetical protein